MGSELFFRRHHRLAIENAAVEAEETMNPVLRVVDELNRWSRILSVNCGFE